MLDSLNAVNRIASYSNVDQDRLSFVLFSTNVQAIEHRIMIRESMQTFDGNEEIFMKLWNDAVSPLYDARPEFMSKKLIVHNHDKSIGMIFSPDFITSFKDHIPLW